MAVIPIKNIKSNIDSFWSVKTAEFEWIKITNFKG